MKHADILFQDADAARTNGMVKNQRKHGRIICQGTGCMGEKA